MPEEIRRVRGAPPGRKPRRGDEVQLAVEAFDARGRGVGTSDGRRVRVRHGIPGETVRARILRRRAGLVDAVAVERVEPSPEAVPARCEHVGSCGGCTLQELAYERQLAGKHRLLRRALAEHARTAELAIDPVLPSPERFRYRNKMEFSFGSRRWIDPGEPPGAASGFALGLHAAELYDKVVDVRACPIQDERADRILASARAIALEHGLSAWDLREHRGLLRHLVLRVAAATGEILVALVTSEDAEAEVGAYASALLRRHPEITTFVHGVNPRPADTAITERERVLSGPGFIVEELGGLSFALSSGSFFQTNTRAAENLVAIVREEARLTGTEVVWDLYSGTGTLGLCLAGSAREVVGFEVVPSAVADARANAERNGIANACFVQGDVLAEVERAAEGGNRPDVLVLDPPRSGLHPRLYARLRAIAPRRVVYVSCNPKAAAADVARLAMLGYEPGRVRPVDLFPHTPHVECAVSLEPRG